VKFPVNFPVSRKYGAESGSLETPSNSSTPNRKTAIKTWCLESPGYEFGRRLVWAEIGADGGRFVLIRSNFLVFYHLFKKF